MNSPYRFPEDPDRSETATSPRIRAAMCGLLVALMFAVGIALGFGSATQSIPQGRVVCVCQCPAGSL